MEPIIPSKKMPVVGEKIVFSEEVKKWLIPSMILAIANNIVYVCFCEESSPPGYYDIGVDCDGWQQYFIIKGDGSPAWGTEFFSKWPVLYWPGLPKHNLEFPIYDLKERNTTPQATHCVKCGGELKDPGLGSAFKHCPICEP